MPSINILLSLFPHLRNQVVGSITIILFVLRRTSNRLNKVYYADVLNVENIRFKGSNFRREGIALGICVLHLATQKRIGRLIVKRTVKEFDRQVGQGGVEVL